MNSNNAFLDFFLEYKKLKFYFYQIRIILNSPLFSLRIITLFMVFAIDVTKFRTKYRTLNLFD